MFLHGLILDPGTLDVVAGLLDPLEELPEGIRVVRIQKILDGKSVFRCVRRKVFPEGTGGLGCFFRKIKVDFCCLWYYR